LNLGKAAIDRAICRGSAFAAGVDGDHLAGGGEGLKQRRQREPGGATARKPHHNGGMNKVSAL
jgi:hypothetical protein